MSRIYEISDTMRELPLYTLPTLGGNNVLVLVDADSDKVALMHEVRDWRIHIIVTSPAKDERSRSWMKQLPGGILVTAYLMNPFFLKEYLLTGFVDLYLFFCFV